LDYVAEIGEDFRERHGDRQFNDDRALVGGTAFFQGKAVMIIAQQGYAAYTKEIGGAQLSACRQPEGCRKALRLMKTAEKFGLPVRDVHRLVAYLGSAPEERHVGGNCGEPTGDGVVARALDRGGRGRRIRRRARDWVTDGVDLRKQLLLGDLAPEGCAAILWNDAAAAPKAAEQ
jgi:acetyl-CoA carboxylase carboxyl transferase subunit alpha